MSEPLCASCGAATRPGAKFCSECGAVQAQLCPACGAAVAGGRFCSECGTAVATPAVASPGGAASAPSASTGATPASVAAPVAERRVVSLLFGDLVGFTPISEARDPEAVRELLSAYFDRARSVVERYGGVVEKFIGDAVFAVWGVPAAREDDAERAVRAGLDLTSAVTALGEELGVEGLQLRVGITTGQVAVTLGAVGEGMVAGDAVNTAARVQSVATANQVWVDDTTRSLTTASLAYAPMGSHELKGKSVPVELFHAVRTTAVVGGDQRVDGLEAPFVGRDRDLGLVKELFHATAEEGRPRLILVAGEPGAGKTRLAWEFEKYVDAIPTLNTWWMRARCLSYGEGVAGRVVAELVRYLLRLSDGDDDATVRARLDERLRRHVVDDAEREVLRPRLESLLGLTDRVFDQIDLFSCWRGFFEALHGDGSPITVVIEDLQWADDGLLDFLDHLLNAARAPITVLALSRPEITERRPGIGSGRRATTVYLEPLSDAAVGKLLDGLVGELPDTLRTELVRRAEGIPLYAVETVRALIDRDVVVPVEGRYVVDRTAARTLDLAALGPPASLQALLSARLDALPDDERRVVQDASVLGMTFTRAAIAALAPAATDVDAALDGLRRKEIITVETDPRSPERGQYRFVQALLRAVAYDTLSRRDRHARHLSAARHLAAEPDAENIAGIIAQHHLDALDAFPDAPDAEELRARAAALLEQAASNAAGIGAPQTAIVHYDRLLRLGADPDTVIRATIAAAQLCSTTSSRAEDAYRWVNEALPLAESQGRELDRLTLMVRLASLSVNSTLDTDPEGLAREVFDASLGHPERVSLVVFAARLLVVLAQRGGDPEQAAAVASQALPDVEKYGDDYDFATLLDVFSMQFHMNGHRRMAGLIRRASVSHVNARDPMGFMSFCNAATLIVPDDPAEAARLAATALSGARSLGSSTLVPTIHSMVADLLLANFDEAAELLAAQRAEGVSDNLDFEIYFVVVAGLFAWMRGDPSLLLPRPELDPDGVDDLVVRSWLYLSRALELALAGDVGHAAETVATAVDLMIEYSPVNEDMPLAFSIAVDVFLAAHATDRLEAATSRLEMLTTGQRFRLLHGQLLRARAHLSDDPVPGLRTAAEAMDAMGAAYCAAQVRVELAEALHAVGDRGGMTEVVAGVEPLLRRTGSAPLVARLERLSPEPVTTGS